MENRKTQERAAQTLLDKGEKITVKWLGIRFRLSIRPLRLGTIIAISEHASKLKDIDLKDSSALQIIGAANKTIRPMAMAAAHGILNRKLKRITLARWLAGVIINSLTPVDMQKILAMIVIQSDPTSFFDCTALLVQMNILNPKSEGGGSKEEKASGEPLQD